MKKVILLLFATMSLTGCQTVKTILANPDYDMKDLFSSHSSFSPNSPFPEKGYKLRGIKYRNVEIQKFTDNDSLLYLKYNPQNEERSFYFSVIDKNTSDSILVYALDKKKISGVYQREEFVDKILILLGIRNYTSNEGLWTYFSPEYKMVKGNLPTDRVRTGYHREYEKFNYKAAQKAYYTQRHPEHKNSSFELLGALYIVNMLFGKDKNNDRIYYDGLYFRNQADVEDYKNANGLK